MVVAVVAVLVVEVTCHLVFNHCENRSAYFSTNEIYERSSYVNHNFH